MSKNVNYKKILTSILISSGLVSNAYANIDFSSSNALSKENQIQNLDISSKTAALVIKNILSNNLTYEESINLQRLLNGEEGEMNDEELENAQDSLDKVIETLQLAKDNII